MPRKIISYLIVSLLVFSPAMAQQRYIQYLSGTGFYIDRAGHLITNAHVVQGCQSISVRLPDSPPRNAVLIATDAAQDLAVIQTADTPPAIATLRWNISDLTVGDALYLYGFPGDAGAEGTPSLTRTKLAAMQGLAGQPSLLQLDRATRQGNSGGPVLDGSGNVIAVIAGYSQGQYTDSRGRRETFDITDYAITLAALRDFLNRHQISTYQSASGKIAYAEPVLAANARRFTANVHCVQGMVTR